MRLTQRVTERDEITQEGTASPIRLAYLILAHKNPGQLIRLIDRLDGPGRAFVVHLDWKSSGTGWAEATEGLQRPNVYWAQRVDCHWGDFTLVQATLNCIRALVETGSRFDFVTLLSGQDYPIKSNLQIEEFLKKRLGQCLMYFYPFPYPEWAWGGYSRLPVWRVNVAGRGRRLVPVHFSRFVHESIPGGLHPCGGSQWWCLPGESVEYINRFVSSNPKFLNYFKRVEIPDELFFHTLLGNSRFRVEPGENSPHFTRWTGGPNPDVLSEADLCLLRESEKLFARKFDTELTPFVLDRLDEDLGLTEQVAAVKTV